MAQQQYFQVSIDDLRRMYPNINLDNYVLMNEDGTQHSVILTEQPVVMDSSQVQQIIYQQPQQSGETQYIIQEDELPADAFGGQTTQQIYYSEIPNNGQIIQHQTQQGTILQAAPIQANIADMQIQQQPIQHTQPVQSVPVQQQQILIQHYQAPPQQQNIIIQQPAQQIPPSSQPPPQLIIQQNVPQQPAQPQQINQIHHQQQLQQVPIQQKVQTIQQQQTNIQMRHQQQQQQQQQQMPPNSTYKTVAVPQVQRTYTMARPRMLSHPPPPPIPIQTQPGIRPPGMRAPALRAQRPPIQRQAPTPQRPRLNAVRPPSRVVTSTPMAKTTVMRPRLPQYTPRPVNPNTVQMVTTTSAPAPAPAPTRPVVVSVAKPPVSHIKAGTVTEPTPPRTPITSSAFNVDLEDSISAHLVDTVAAKIVKLAPTSQQNVSQLLNASITDEQKKVALTNGQVMSLADFKRQQLLQQQKMQNATKQQHVQQLINSGAKTQNVIPGVNARPRPRANAVYNANAPKAMARPQLQQNVGGLRQLTPPSQPQIQQQQIVQPDQQIIEREPRESARMLVILQNGEQRLITFTLPKESCTVQELLDQVGVPFSTDTNIQCIPNPGVNIDYLVTVGVQFNEPASEIISAAENSLQKKQLEQQQAMQSGTTTTTNSLLVALQQKQQQQLQQQQENANAQKPADPPPKYISNMCAVCYACGYSSYNHAQCQRCRRVFTEEPKKMVINTTKAKITVANSTVPATPPTVKQKRDLAAIQKKFQLTNADALKNAVVRNRPARAAAKRVAKPKVEEPVILMLSSDDEDNPNEDSQSSNTNNKETLLPCEPTTQDFVEPEFETIREDVLQVKDSLKTTIHHISAVNIGTFRFKPTEPIVFTSKGIRMVANSVKNPNEKCVINLMKHEIVKAICYFGDPSKESSVIILHVLNGCSEYVREAVEMSTDPYFSPFSQNSFEKCICIQFDRVAEDNKSVISLLFPADKIDVINTDDKKRLLNKYIQSEDSKAWFANEMIQKVLIYPPEGKGGISINTEDYLCLATDQYLNDVIIDFYLQYVHHEMLSEAQRARTHVFSTFFYKRLTTLTSRHRNDKDVKLTPAQKRHDRVKTWTKNVNLFEKDYIIIPINEQSHWFLAIICFPALKGPVTYDSLQPVKAAVSTAKKKAATERKSLPVQIGSTTITPVSKQRDESICLEDDGSERDEAEGDESDVASDESEPEVELPTRNQPIKQPCILIFDSLAGASRSRVVATLRDYLTCEYRAKILESTNHSFTKHNIPGHNVKVPQQTNFTDCGLYLLQYVENFFNEPIKDYKIPIKHLTNWFEPIVATRKREDLSNLIKNLVDRYNLQIAALPEIAFPTIDGKLVEPAEFEEHADFEEQEDADMENNETDANTPELKVEPVVEKKRLIYKPNDDSEVARKKRRNV